MAVLLLRFTNLAWHKSVSDYHVSGVCAVFPVFIFDGIYAVASRPMKFMGICV